MLSKVLAKVYIYISENCRLCLVVVVVVVVAVVVVVLVSTVASFYMEIWGEVFSQSDCRSLMYRDSPGQV